MGGGVRRTLLGGPHLAVHRVRALFHRSCREHAITEASERRGFYEDAESIKKKIAGGGGGGLTSVRIDLPDLDLGVLRFLLFRGGHTVLVIRLCSTARGINIPGSYTEYIDFVSSACDLTLST